jgi:hypothetical protein
MISKGDALVIGNYGVLHVIYFPITPETRESRMSGSTASTGDMWSIAPI